MTIYTKQNCVPCKTLKLWADRAGHRYEEKPIEEHIQKLTDMGFMSAPVVNIGDRWISGTRISDVAQALKA